MRKTKHWLMTIAALLCSFTVSAHDFVDDGIYYNFLSKEDKTVEVTYYGSYPNTSNEYHGHVVIPESIIYGGERYEVVAIKQNAFAFCEDVTGVTIPRTIKSIGIAAFGVNEVETDFTTVHITDLEAWCRIDFGNIASNPLSHAEYLYLNGELITDLVIPEGVDEIKDYAFYGFSGSVTIPSSVTKIGTDAFRGITSVHISDLKAWCNIDFSAALLYYANNLYLNGELVTELIIPEGVTEIKNLAFAYCTSIESVSIPSTVVSIANNAFLGCSELANISVEEGNLVYDSRENCNVVIETSTNSLYLGCKNTIIPESVANIGDHAFQGSSLVSIAIPNSVTNIGEYAFSGCSSLNSITIPESVTNIGERAFQDCSSLNSIIIPNSVENIGEGAFAACGLTSFVIPESLTTIQQRTFSGCSSLTCITIPSNITSIGYEAFYDCI